MGLFTRFSSVHVVRESSLIVSGDEHQSFSSNCCKQDGSGFNINKRDFHKNRDNFEEMNEILDFPESSSVPISRRYEFFSDNSISGYIEGPKSVSLVVRDIYLCSDKTEELSVKKNTEDLSCEQKKLESFEPAAMEHEEQDMTIDEFRSYADAAEQDIFSDDDEFIEMNFEEHEDYNFSDGSDDDDEDDEMMERLKMEIRMARTGGLSTILEDLETPLEELKPLKIDSKFELKNSIAEIRKIHKSYTFKMRRLDVLDSQTTHSINLIKLKDPRQSCRNIDDYSAKSSKSNLREKLWPFKTRKLECDPIDRLVKEASRDFEVVYICQLCLSWEILHWQYLKVIEFLQNDRYKIYQYNFVAGEFQLFQVLIQRFMENEPFQGCPRVQYYLKHRRLFHNFLRVPLVRDDGSLKKKKCRNEGAFAIRIEMLRKIIEESMSVFWALLCSDKHKISSNVNNSHQTQVSPQDPLDLELLSEINRNLYKKEKRLKEILRSQTCIVKKMKKEAKRVRVKDEEMVIAQVELRLVSRVTKMPKLTSDQLVWCREKLNKINFNGRKIRIEPSFSLFPC